jgi:hypothetical protein
MQNKSRTRTDVQWIVSSVSLAVTLGLWGLFAGHEKKGVGVTGQVAITPPTEQVVVSQPQQPGLVPGQVLLFGGTAPQPQQTVVITRTRSKGGGGGGGGGPAASTHSSHP